MDRGEKLTAVLWDTMNKKYALEQSAMKTVAPGLNPSEVRCIDYVGKHANVNATKLAEAFFITTGAASKLTKKLLNKGLLTRFQKLENRKEIYFKLTEAGRVVFEAQESLQREFIRRDEPIFRAMGEEQYESVLEFAQTYGTHLETFRRQARRNENQEEK